MRVRVLGALTILAAVAWAAGCTTTDAPPPVPVVSSASPVAAPSPTPIDGLPTDHTASTVNAHVAAGTWAFIATETADTIGVRINNLWQGEPGSLAERNYSQAPSQAPVDIDTAVPYFLSWSYVILDGADDAQPEAIVMPTQAGNLYNVASAFTDHDCPDYQAPIAQGVGFLVTRCAVSVSADGAYPAGLAFAVPSQEMQYWFLDAPAAAALP